MPLPSKLKPKAFHASIKGSLDKLEKQRLLLVGALGGAAAVYVAVLVVATFQGILPGVSIWGLGLPGGVAAWIWLKRRGMVDGTDYRNLVLARLASKVSPATSFEPAGDLPEALLAASHLNPVPGTGYAVSSQLKQGPATLATVTLSRPAGKGLEILAEGLFVVVEGLAPREGAVVWAPDRKAGKGGTAALKEGGTGSLKETGTGSLKEGAAGPLKRVNLDDPWFASHHPVRATTKAAAARLKSDTLRAGLVELSEAHRHKVGIAFVDDKAFAWLPLQPERSRWSPKRAMTDPDLLKEPLAQFEVMLGLLEGFARAVASELATPNKPASATAE